MSTISSTLSILIFGSLFLLSFQLITNPIGKNKKANRFLGLFFLLWSTYWIENLPPLTVFFHDLHPVKFIVPCLQFWAPLLFYFSVLFFTNPNTHFRKKNIYHLILPIVNTAGYIVLYLYPSEILNIVLIGLMLVNATIFLVLSYIRLRKHQDIIPHFASETNEIELNWLTNIVLAIMLLHVGITIYNIAFYPRSLDMFTNLFILAIAYFTGYHALKQKEIYPKNEQQREEVLSLSEPGNQPSPKKKLMNDEEMLVRKVQLSDLMNDKEPFLDCELNLSSLAKLAEQTPHQLSYVINNGFNENFFQFINRYRVLRAKKLLSSPSTEKLSMVGIAFESGFNSKTSFNTTFKKLVGQTPSEFKESTKNV